MRTAVVLMITLTASLWIYGMLSTSRSQLANAELQLDAASALLMDAHTGKILYEENSEQAMPPASMSKMMVELIVLEDIRAGKLDWEDRVTASEYAASVIGAQAGFQAGAVLSVKELFEAMAVHSANDAAVALAEHIEGSERKFVERMNKQAKQIGLSSHTRFANATGLSPQDLTRHPEAASDEETVMTALDTAKLTRKLITEHPEVLEITSRSEILLQSTNITLQNTNWMLPGQPHAYPGNDGMKTGYTAAAGYCFTGTSEQQGKRLIAVVFGTKSPEARFIETKKLFLYGFEGRGALGWTSRLKSAL